MKSAAYAAVAALVLAAHFGTAFNVLMVLAASFPVLFVFGADRGHRDGITVSMGVTLLGVVWIGIPLVHAVLLRDLPNHGAALLVDVLVGTFVTDTAAYATGRMFGSHKIAPSLSPNKTLEGLIGGFLIGTMGFWFAGLYQNWLSGVDALIIGAAVAAIAPLGDLFESMLKRDLGRKDTGTSSAPTEASSTASTPSSSPSSSATTSPSSLCTDPRSRLTSPRKVNRHLGALPSLDDEEVLILGSTGSIGTQALEVVAASAELEVVGLAAGSDWERLLAQARQCGAPAVALADAAPRSKRAGSGTGGSSPARRGFAS